MNNYLHPELSLLSFNERVLNMALDESVPLLERLRFLCIFSSNMDEFFEIRVSGLKAKAQSSVSNTGVDGIHAQSAIDEINTRAHGLVDLQYQTLNDTILPELAQEGVRFVWHTEFNAKQKKWLKNYFKKQVLPILTPIRLDPAHPFPITINKGLSIVVDLHDPGREDVHNIAIVPAPRALPRVIRLPEELSELEYEYVYLSSIIHDNVEDLFPNVEVLGCYQFRITRNSDLYVDLEEVDDLARTLEGELPSRMYGEAVRLEVSKHCPKKIVNFLTDRFQMDKQFVYKVDGPVNMHRLISLPDLINRNHLKYTGFTPSVADPLKPQHNIFETIINGDILLHHPFESFSPVLELLRQAAHDPDVLVIKQTLYRTGSDSVIIEYLCDAARAGKEVTVIVELMARFDEENNLSIAQKLQAAGAHVVYGVVGKKTHAKMMLIVRREGGKLNRYVHLGTGNYHQGNTRVYTDYGYMTTRDDITSDVHEIFMQLTTQGPNPELQQLTQSPHGIRDMIVASIEREAENAKAGKTAKIIVKVNGLASPGVIQALYDASQAGVQIDLIVRGICCLRPGIEGLSENIRVRSIVGRFLEHGRIYYFHNNGEDNVYLASADWMPRNLINRIEQCTPILDAQLKQRIIDDLNLYLSDNSHAWQMHGDGSYTRLRCDEPDAIIDAQKSLLEHSSEED